MNRLHRLTSLFILLLAALPGARAEDAGTGSGGTWLVRIEEDASGPDVARRLGAVYVEPLKGVEGYHRLRFQGTLESRKEKEAFQERVVRRLEEETTVRTFEEERWLERVPFEFVPRDPRFPEQWHWENVGQSGGVPFADIRVRPAWDAGLSGSGVTVAIVDEGTEFRHPDLIDNWLPGSGFDFNDDDSDPSPEGVEDRHGTAVAGITLAASNTIGGLGVAHRARMVPLRLIAGRFQTGDEAEALSHRKQEVDIYNNSWGPSSEGGVRYVNTSSVLKNALADNVRTGRGGRGNIYVWAAGNGGLNGDNSNYDGYNTSPYTISVGAVGDDGIRPGYSEPGANLLVAAPSGGRGGGILTTDNTGPSGYAAGDVYTNFGGTSAAAPIVSGVVALMLEQRPELGWRDVQQILALSASPVDFDPAKWSRNGVGHWVSHEYGFGRVDASAAVSLAANWPLLGPMQTVTGADSSVTGLPLQLNENETLRRTVTVAEDISVQHVQVRARINHDDWGDLRIELVSPAGTRSILAESHANANNPGSPGDWTYLSTHYLGEGSSGLWTLEVTDEASGGEGSLQSWNLEIRGTHPGEVENRPPEGENLFVESTTFPIEVDLLEGVEDPDGDEVSLISLQHPRAGKLEEIGEGRFLFTMGDTKNGVEVFSGLISDGRGAVRRRLVEVLDPRPVAQNDLFPVEAGTSVSLPVLRNDVDPDDDPLRITDISGSFTGSVRIGEDGTLLYQSPSGFSGVERIRYTLSDDSDGESSGWVTVIVQESPDIALQFDGVDDYLRFDPTPSLDMTDRFTAEAWIYAEDWGEYVTGFGRIFDRETFVLFLNGFDHSLYNDQSLVAFLVLDDGSSVAINTNPGSLALDTWQHVAISFDSSAEDPVAIYIDGEPVPISIPLPETSTPRRPLSDNRNWALYMGEAASGARAFEGRMTEFRIWDRVLSAESIRDRHDRRLEGSEEGLDLYLPLSQTLDPMVVSRGSLPMEGIIFEARRIPLDLPWEALEERYAFIADAGNGWWEERTLGWLYGDFFPWVFIPGLDWVFTGHESSGDPYELYRSEENWGWLRTDSRLYPWFLHHASGDWIWYLEDSSDPGWFYAQGFDWFSGERPFPLN